MADPFEEEYADVLQNIEFALMQVYHAHPEMVDWDTTEAINALIRSYQAEALKKPTRALKLNPLHQEIFDAVQAMCEWRLGRAKLPGGQEVALDAKFEPVSVDEILACLKRVRRSIEMWNKELGRRGYFDFVSRYVK